MDSIRKKDDPWMRIWKVLFGGDTLLGRWKLYLFLVGYLLLGGLTLAQLA